MAELSTLSPSPPALGDPHTAPSIPPSSTVLPSANSPSSESAREIASPKSSLYTDKALMGHPLTAQSGASPSIPPKVAAEAAVTVLRNESVSEERLSFEQDAGETGAHIVKQEMMGSDPANAGLLSTDKETPALSSEPSSKCDVQPAPPSPELSSGPNLYPNVHVTHNPNPVIDDGHLQTGPHQAVTTSNPMSAFPASTNMAAVAEEERPQPLPQAQKPQSEPPPLSPKSDAKSDAVKADLPSTPTRAEPPSPTVPLIHEPACALPLPLPNPKPRPAPDTLSYLESASLMSGTLESLSGLGEDGSSVGSDSEINGLAVRRTDKYGFLGGNQYSDTG